MVEVLMVDMIDCWRGNAIMNEHYQKWVQQKSIRFSDLIF